MTKTSTSALKKQGGFTLLEILISIGLLAILSLSIYQTTSSSFDLNARLSGVTLDATTIALGLQTVENDFSQIYSPMLGPIPNRGGETKVEAFWSPPLRSDGLRRTRLNGAGDKVTFVSNNNRRVEADTPQSDFQKVTWEVERNSSNKFTLYRSTDWDAFRYDDAAAKKPERVAILENLSSAKFTFYRRDTKVWEDHWDSENAYAKEEQRFPDMISLKIEAPDPDNNANQRAWEVIVRPNLQLNYLDANARANLKNRTVE